MSGDTLAHQLLSSTIKYLLEQESIQDAVFLAEILHAEAESPTTAHLLAKCYYRLGRYKECHHLLSDHPNNPQCVLLYARACLKLKEYQSGLNYLRGLLCMNTGDESYYVSKFGKDVAIAFALLGDLNNRRLHLSREACQAYRLALKYNPFLWTTFDNVCHLDRNSSPSEVFKLAQLPDFLREDPNVAIATNVPIAKKPLPLLAESLKEERANFTPNFVPNSFMNPPVLGKAIVSSTPSLPCMMTPLHFDSEQTKSFSSSSVQQVLPQALQFSAANTPSSLKTKPDMSCHNVDTEQDPTLQEIPHEPSHQLRRSPRLGGGGGGKTRSSLAFSRHRMETHSPLTVSRSKSPRLTNKSSAYTKMKRGSSFINSPTKTLSNKRPSHPLMAQEVDENKPHDESDEKDEEKMDTLSSDAIKENIIYVSFEKLMLLLQSLGIAHHHVVNYRSKDAIKAFHGLSLIHQNIPWVLTQMGRALMIGENFKEAVKYFSKVHNNCPHRQEGMDYYGSTLWHLQKETELALLAEELTSSDKNQPQTLCVLSSLMNYYKDHETAIRYLERAIQLDPTSPYLQTLLGLEYTLLKDYDKALLAFQSATNLDPYHFNGWFGLSHLYFQQENWLKAEASVKRSLDLNSHSSIAYTQLAMIQQKQGYFTNALMTIDKALSCNTSNNLPKFHKALILESLGKFNESLKILESLVVGLPKEPSFYKAMSRVLLKLNRPQESILRMAWSMDYSHNSCGLVAGMALVRPHRQHSIENFEIFEDSDFIPHSDESGSFSAENA